MVEQVACIRPVSYQQYCGNGTRLHNVSYTFVCAYKPLALSLPSTLVSSKCTKLRHTITYKFAVVHKSVHHQVHPFLIVAVLMLGVQLMDPEDHYESLFWL